MTDIIIWLGFIFGILSFIVKVCPTISAKFPWLVELIKILGKLTNRQTEDSIIRAQNYQGTTK